MNLCKTPTKEKKSLIWPMAPLQNEFIWSLLVEKNKAFLLSPNNRLTYKHCIIPTSIAINHILFVKSPLVQNISKHFYFEMNCTLYRIKTPNKYYSESQLLDISNNELINDVEICNNIDWTNLYDGKIFSTNLFENLNDWPETWFPMRKLYLWPEIILVIEPQRCRVIECDKLSENEKKALFTLSSQFKKQISPLIRNCAKILLLEKLKTASIDYMSVLMVRVMCTIFTHSNLIE